MEASKLREILEKHKMWLNGEEGGERADLSVGNLYGANLRGADLREATLRGVILREANLMGADLRGVDLFYADLRGVDLFYGNLREAELRGANLMGADLSGADLSGADLIETDLRRANLRGANLRGADGIPAICCPEEGSFIGFKKAGDYIVKLLILDDAKRSSATSRKCRCSKAKVLSITELDGSETDVTEVESNYNSNFIYRVGEIVEVPNFDDDRWNRCAPGIHFFITRQEAVEN